MRSYEIIATSTTTASPQRIFAVLDDFRGWPRWMPAFEHITVELPAERAPRLGYRFRLRSGLVHTDMQVVDFTDLSRATTFRVSFPPLTGTNRCRLQPIGDGSYRIERVDSIDLPEIVAGLLDATQRARFERLALDFLERLIRVAEAEG
jgi:hypothetical protein